VSVSCVSEGQTYGLSFITPLKPLPHAALPVTTHLWLGHKRSFLSFISEPCSSANNGKPGAEG
jgi:hypothetical protein